MANTSIKIQVDSFIENGSWNIPKLSQIFPMDVVPHIKRVKIKFSHRISQFGPPQQTGSHVNLLGKILESVRINLW